MPGMPSSDGSASFDGVQSRGIRMARRGVVDITIQVDSSQRTYGISGKEPSGGRIVIAKSQPLQPRLPIGVVTVQPVVSAVVIVEGRCIAAVVGPCSKGIEEIGGDNSAIGSVQLL